MIFNRLTAFICAIAISAVAAAQVKQPKIKFGDIKPEDFKPQYYTVDSSADAVYLYDIGSSVYEGNNNGWFSVIFKVHERIRLLNKKSFDDLGTVKIPLYATTAIQQKLKDLQAATYFMEEGKLVATKVDKNSIFKDRDGDYQVTKFTSRIYRKVPLSNTYIRWKLPLQAAMNLFQAGRSREVIPGYGVNTPLKFPSSLIL